MFQTSYLIILKAYLLIIINVYCKTGYPYTAPDTIPFNVDKLQYWIIAQPSSFCETQLLSTLKSSSRGPYFLTAHLDLVVHRTWVCSRKCPVFSEMRHFCTFCLGAACFINGCTAIGEMLDCYPSNLQQNPVFRCIALWLIEPIVCKSLQNLLCPACWSTNPETFVTYWW